CRPESRRRASAILWLAARLDALVRPGARVLHRARTRGGGLAGCAISAAAAERDTLEHGLTTTASPFVPAREDVKQCLSAAAPRGPRAGGDPYAEAGGCGRVSDNGTVGVCGSPPARGRQRRGLRQPAPTTRAITVSAHAGAASLSHAT